MKGLCLTPTGQARVHLDNTFSIKVAEWRAVYKTTRPPGLDHSLCQGEWTTLEGVHGPGWHLQVTGEATGSARTGGEGVMLRWRRHGGGRWLAGPPAEVLTGLETQHRPQPSLTHLLTQASSSSSSLTSPGTPLWAPILPGSLPSPLPRVPFPPYYSSFFLPTPH